MVSGRSSWFSDVLSLVRLEIGHFVRFRQQRIAAIAVCFLPAIYVAIYVGSVWDPAAHSSALPVAVVNLDQGLQYQGQDFNVGRDIENQLRQRKTFGFVSHLTADQAQDGVRHGALAFALVIPTDFSAKALPGTTEGAGQLDVYLSEGNNYQSAQIARRFAEELGHSVNDNINRTRWSMVLLTAKDSRQNLDRLYEGVHALSLGARALAAGTAKAEAGARDVAHGSRTLDDGLRQASGKLRPLMGSLRQLDDSRPHDTDLQQLLDAMDAIERGHRDLGAGLAALGTGTGALNDGIHRFRLEAEDNWLFPSAVAENLVAADQGAAQVASGMRLAISAQHELQNGSSQVFLHVRTLAHSLGSVNQSLNASGGAMPDEQTMDRLNAGTGQLVAGATELAAGQTRLREGSVRLSAGLAALETALNVSLPAIDGTAEGLAGLR